MEEFIELVGGPSAVAWVVAGIWVWGRLKVLYKYLINYSKKQEQEVMESIQITELSKRQKSSDDGLREILHLLLYDKMMRHIKEGSISTEDWQDIEALYKRYKSYNGNGAIDRLYVQLGEEVRIIR